MLATPSTSHVNYDHIYEPSEDSYLLLDTLSSAPEKTFLQTHFPAPESPSPLVLEIGPGSGVVLAFITAHAEHIFGRADVGTLGLDANPLACVATRETTLLATAQQKKGAAGIFLDGVCGDLTSAIRAHEVDVLVFNPPYVPTAELPTRPPEGSSVKDFERDMYLSSLATDGGADGMEITDRLLSQLPSVLSRRGIAYILLCAGNKPDNVISRITEWEGDDSRSWKAERVGSSGNKAGWERLCVVRIWRS